MALLIDPSFRATDRNGAIVIGGTITVYTNRTTTLASIYSDPDLTVALTNPVTLDDTGSLSANIYVTPGLSFTVKLTKSDATDVWTHNDWFGWSPGVMGFTVTTVAGLSALTPAAHDIVYFLDRGHYRFDATSTATGDDLLTIEPDSGTGRWILVENQTMRLSQLGTTLDGSTDNTSAMSYALATVAPKELILNGDAVFNSDFLVPSTTKLVIQGTVTGTGTLTAERVVNEKEGWRSGFGYIDLRAYNGYPDQGSAIDITPALNAAMTYLSTSASDRWLYITEGAYYFNTEPPVRDFQASVRGDGMFTTTLYKNFQSTNIWNGVITHTDNADGSIVEDLAVIGVSGSTNGTAGTGCGLGLYSVNADGSISFVNYTRVRVTTDSPVGADRYKYGIYWNGTNATSGALGLRACTMTNVQVFGAELGSAYLAGMNSCNVSGASAFNSAGGTTGVLVIDGSAAVANTGLNIDAGAITDGLSFGYTERVSVRSANIGGSMTLTANSRHVRVDTAEYSGTTPVVDAAVRSEFLFNNGAQSQVAVTISGGVIDVPVYAQTAFLVVDTEASAATDDLDTINGHRIGQIITLRSASNARDVVVKDGTGNINNSGSADVTLNNTADSISFVYNGSQWLPLAPIGDGGA